jgi:GT2 family glycosyltransferase
LVLHNRAELTLVCLQSVLATVQCAYEVILVDNASTDETGKLLERIHGAQIVRNRENLGYPIAVNQACRLARGKNLLLLNNDTQLLGSSVRVAERFLSDNPGVGAVGGRVLQLEGCLQEAGNIVWQDGYPLAYGRSRSPDDPSCTFQRDVDYCSGVFLMTPREVFLNLEGYDETFSPAYFEDVDYCLRLWQSGWRVVYHPDIALLHYEFGSSLSMSQPHELMTRNHAYFFSKHRWWLASRYPNVPSNLQKARSLAKVAGRILFIEDRVPHGQLGSGMPRACQILRDLVSLGYFVTFYPLCFPQDEFSNATADVPEGVEVMTGYGTRGLPEFLKERHDYYDIVLVSRPHNMEVLRNVLSNHPESLGQTKVIYDAEAIYCGREAQKWALLGRPWSPRQIRDRLQEELNLAKGCWAVVAVSETEARPFQRSGFDRVYRLGHSLDVHPGLTDFSARNGLLFVGPIHAPDTPNADSVRWLLGNIVPHIVRQTSTPIKLSLVGSHCPEFLSNSVTHPQVRVLGPIKDLRPVYDQARLFVAPTRFAAGIPLKVYEAAAHGLPVVATSLLAAQVGWRHERELLVADTSEEFATQCLRAHENVDLWQRLRNNALEAVQRDCNPRIFTDTLQAMVQEALGEPVSEPLEGTEVLPLLPAA